MTCNYAADMKSVYFQKSGIQTPSNLKCIVSYVLKYGFGKGNTLYGFQANILGENRLRNNEFAPKNCIFITLPLLSAIQSVIITTHRDFDVEREFYGPTPNSALDILI